jgi:hypothetical protein
MSPDLADRSSHTFAYPFSKTSWSARRRRATSTSEETIPSVPLRQGRFFAAPFGAPRASQLMNVIGPALWIKSFLAENERSPRFVQPARRQLLACGARALARPRRARRRRRGAVVAEDGHPRPTERLPRGPPRCGAWIAFFRVPVHPVIHVGCARSLTALKRPAEDRAS